MTTMSAVIPSPSPVPSIAAYNIRFLSLSDSSEQRAQHQRKLGNVQHLLQQYTMTALLETHVTGAKAELFFCRYVEGTRRVFINGMAVIVQETRADHFNPALVTFVDGVIVALVWEYDGSNFLPSFSVWTHMLKHHVSISFDKLLNGQKRMFPAQTLCASPEIGILLDPILKGGVVRRQCGDHPCA